MTTPSLARPAKGRKPPTPPTPPATLTRISTEEAAALLDMHRSTLLAMAKRGKVPHQPLGERRFIFYREKLERWREECLAAGLEGQP